MLNIRLERGEFRDVENGEWWMVDGHTPPYYRLLITGY
jgi:hypothetical protein